MMQTVTATTGRASVRAIARGTGAVRGANARSVKTTAAALGGDNEDNVGPSQLFHDGVKALEEKGTTAAAHVSTANNDALGKTGKCPFLGAKENEILKNSADRESNARGYVRKFPMAIKEAKGIMLTDVNGRKYYDILGCAGTLALGHNHDVTIKAIKDFLETGAPLQVLDLATPHKDEFIETLQSVLPDELSRLHFCSPAGTDCLDAAVKLCKIATGRRSVLSFHGGYHGMGQSMLSLMGNLGAKTPVTGLMPDVYFLPYPYEHRNPFGVKGEEGEKAVLHYIDTVLSDDESGVPKPACVVVEAIQGEGGVNEMSDWALRELRRITKKHDVPLVMDEVQAGFCRSGDFFAFNKSGIVPDVLCMSKAVGGSMPMATIAFTQELDVWGPAAHTGTFRGNQLAFATGTASINFMKETKMWEDVRRKGEVLRARMLKLQEETNVIGHVRGRGLMQGVELVDPNAPTDRMGLAPPSGALAAEVQLQCFKRGMLMEKGGRMGGVMRFLAPLIITDEELDICIGKFEESVKAAAAKHGM